MAAGDLTTLANVRSFMQKATGDTDQDTLVNALIARASRAIHVYTEREFATTASNPATRVFSYAGGGLLSLAPYDLQSASAVVLDSDRATTIPLVSGTDYFLGPRPQQNGVYSFLRIPTYGATLPESERAVSVTGTWGWAAVPADVEHWCIVTVVTWLRRDVAAFSTTFSLDEERVERPEALPSAVRAGLAPYRRIAVG